MEFKRALVTGASSGIGEATAHALAAEKISLLLVARRSERLDKVAIDIRAKYGVTVHTLPVDIRRPQNVEFLVGMQDIDKVDILINNAGLARGVEKIQDGKSDDWEAMIDTNITGLLRVTRVVLPHMIKAGKGHIVNIGSVAGRWTYPGGAVYCATKFAVRALSEGMRMDLMGTPIRVTNIEPGMVESEFSEVRLQSKERAKGVYKGMTPLTPEDVAETIVWSLMRPPHVNIQELVLMPTDQAAIGMVHRKDAEKPL